LNQTIEETIDSCKNKHNTPLIKLKDCNNIIGREIVLERYPDINVYNVEIEPEAYEPPLPNRWASVKDWNNCMKHCNYKEDVFTYIDEDTALVQGNNIIGN